MKLTIIPIDGAVYVDGVSYAGLDLSGCQIPDDVHALQWKDTAGWIEFVDNADGIKPQNQLITELPLWANEAKAKWDEAKWDEAKAAQEAQPITEGTQPA